MTILIAADPVAVGLVLAAVLGLIGLAGVGGYRWAQRDPLGRGALQALPLGVVVVASNGRHLFANNAARLLLPAVGADRLADVCASSARGLHPTMLAGAAPGLIQLQGGALGAGRVLVVLRDISAQQRTSTQYQQFIHSLSHELLTPLTAIQGHLAHLEASAAPETNGAGSLAIVRTELERLTRLTSNLLLLSRLEAGQPVQRRPTNLAAVAEEAVLQLLTQADARQINLVLNVAPHLPRPAVDRDAWKQVFLNLLDNGIKYNRPGGTLALTLTSTASCLQILVRDDGPGIAADDLPHLFTPLFRAEGQRRVAGSGLGLTIVQRIVEQHGGQIGCQSNCQEGTTFTIILPWAADGVTNS